MEWTHVPDIAAYAVSALERTLELSDGLQIHPERMNENLGLTHQLVYAEAIMMALAPEVGRQKAHDLVDAAVVEALGGKQFVDALQQSEEINDILSASELSQILDGQAHIEAAYQEVKEVLAVYERGKEPAD